MFSDVTSDDDLALLLSAAYGGDIDNLDAFTGALAEDSDLSSGGFFGTLLHETWVEQLFRTIAGDRFYHVHERFMEDASLATLSGLINGTLDVTDLPLSVFQAPGVTVCAGDCESVEPKEATLSDSYGLSWEVGC